MFPFDLFPLKFDFETDEQMMLLFAIMIDGASYLLLCVGMDDWWVLDAAAWSILVPWVISKGGGMQKKGGNGLMSKLVGRFIGCGVIELIPYLGSILPTWLLYVYSVARDRMKGDEGSSRMKRFFKSKIGKRA